MSRRSTKVASAWVTPRIDCSSSDRVNSPGAATSSSATRNALAPEIIEVEPVERCGAAMDFEPFGVVVEQTRPAHAVRIVAAEMLGRCFEQHLVPAATAIDAEHEH